MGLEMKVPSVGESVTEVTIASWIKKEGDYVKIDEILCELESDKATFELPAEAAGYLHILAKEGETLSIGAPICVINDGESTEKESVSNKIIEEEKKPAESLNEMYKDSGGQVKDIIIPTVGESITEVVLSSWVKNQGDFVNADEIICELESDKATFELPSPVSGILNQIAKPGATIQVGGLIGTVSEVSKPEGSQAPKETVVTKTDDAKVEEKQVSSNYASGTPSPSAAKILAEKDINPSTVSGTGVSGRITKEDALKASSSPSTQTNISPEIKSFETEANRVTHREKMSSIRKTIARRLVAVKNETAMLTTFNEVDMKPIMDLRAEYKEKFKEKHGVGLGFMSFFTKACSTALLEFPAVNAFIDGEDIVFNDFTDISIAVSSPKGLLVPVIRNAELLNFAEIESEVVRLAIKARDGKLTIPEMTGGTFTITNGGIFGSMLSTPIINSPQSAILGMHNIVERPVVINGQIEIRPIMYVALSYDHRIIDGKDSVSFLVRVKQLLEDPTRMLLGV